MKEHIMRRIIAMFLVLGLVFGAVATAEAAKKKKKKPKKVSRTVEAEYQLPGFGTASVTVGCSPALGSCGNFAIGPDENFAKITLADTTGTPVAFSVGQDTEPGDPTNTIETNHGTFCGTTGDDPLPILGGVEMTVFIWAWGDILCPTGFGTTGTVTAEFSNLP